MTENMVRSVLVTIMLCVFSFLLGRYSAGDLFSKNFQLSKSSEILKSPREIVKLTPVKKTVLAPKKEIRDRVSSAQASNQRRRLDLEARAKRAEIESLMKIALKYSLNPNSDRDFNVVVRAYDRILAINPKHQEALQYYSNYLVLQEELEASLPILNQCVQFYPKNELCAGNLTVYYLVKNDLNELKNSIDRCFKNIPNSSMCLFSRGNYFLKTHKYRKALLDFKKLDEAQDPWPISYSSAVLAAQIAQAYEGMQFTQDAVFYRERACREGDEFSCKKLNLENDIGQE